MKKERFEAITDAVMAILLTIMVLEIKIPELTIENIPQILQQIFIYAISFMTIAIIWLNHHRMFLHAEKINIGTVWINFCWLFTISLIPLATDPLSKAFDQKINHMFYGAVLTVVLLCYSLLHRGANKQSGKTDRISKMNWAVMGVYLLSVPLSYLSIYISGTIFLLIPVLYFILSTRQTV